LNQALSAYRMTGDKLEDAIVRLGLLSGAELLPVLAEVHGVAFVFLDGITIPPEVIELIPESVARENIVLPLAGDAHTLRVAVCDPADFDKLQKLQFILNKAIQPVLALRAHLIEAINRHYGQTETESVD